jgi:hypothetical protein
VNQSTTDPDGAVAESAVAPPGHTNRCDAITPVGAPGTGFTVTVAEPDAVIAHPRLSVALETEYTVCPAGDTEKFSGLDPMSVPPPLLSVTVYGGTPPDTDTVTVLLVPAHTVPPPLTLAVIVGHVTPMEALAVTPSTVADALPAPGVFPAVYVPVAVPAAWIVPCVPVIDPSVAPHATGRPAIAVRFALAMSVLSELCDMSAVTLDVAPSTTLVGDAVTASLIHGLKSAVPAATVAGVFVPHQLFSTLAPPALAIPMSEPLVFPTIRLKFAVSTPAPPAATASPPPEFSAVFPVIVHLLTVAGYAESMYTPPPCPTLAPFA